MSLGQYQLLAQLGAGRDGIAYRARSGDGREMVELRVLTGARTDAGRWKHLGKRLRLAALLDHPAAVRLRALALEQDPPYVALEWAGDDFNTVLDRLPLPTAEVPARARDLAAVLAEAHRLGLAHGGLGPRHLRLTDTGSWKIDFTAIDCQPPSEPTDFAGLPEVREQASPAPDPAADIYALGTLFSWMLEGPPRRGPTNGIEQLPPLAETALRGQEVARVSLPLILLIRAMCAPEPADRPLAREVHERLTKPASTDSASQTVASGAPAAQSVTVAVDVTTAFPPAPRQAPAGERVTPTRLRDRLLDDAPPGEETGNRQQLGRFRLLEKLGQGGMGSVYRAEDVTDGTVAAVKVLRGDWVQHAEALRRFHKEARLLAEVHNPYVANLLEVNEDDGVHYLAMEFVAGRSLGRLLAERGRLDERTALGIMADVCRALADAHQQGIVHRDIKPENILLVEEVGQGNGQTTRPPSPPRVKLTDFGLARHVVESESLNVTRAGAVLGTPLYMAPEQCSGIGTVDARTDVYAMGATLYHLLAGRPPFLAETPLALIALHCNEPVPPLKQFNPETSDGVCQIVAKSLAKSQSDRYADAGAFLQDLERLLRGEPTSIRVHPQLPECDPARMLQYDWTWELESSPAQLWPHVSNTERLNHAVGLSPVQFTDRLDTQSAPSDKETNRLEKQPHPSSTPRGRVRRFGKFRKAGLTVAYEEQPFEWIEARRFGVLREYTHGPFKWFISLVELEPRTDGGTRLTHRVRLEPHGVLGRTVAAVEVGIRGRRAVARVYRRIDAYLTGKLGSRAFADPFEEPAELPAASRRRLEELADRLMASNVDPNVVERISEFLAHAPAQEVARIRPLALARRLALDPNQVVAACLHGAREGLFILLWDILCPLCRIPSEIKETLRALRDHGRCAACNMDFELDFANSVEMIFRVHPEIRPSELGTYCIGGPAHSPHVAAQVRLGPGERIELDLNLTEGAYRLRGPQLPFGFDFHVQPKAAVARCEIVLSRGPEPELPRSLGTGRQLFILTNDFQQEVVLRVERTAPRDDALTAARATALALFRELFPGEILSPGQLVSVANVTLLVTALAQAGDLYARLGDVRAFALLHEHFRLLEERVRREGGALVKTLGEGIVAAFTDAVAAVRAGLDFPKLLAQGTATKGLQLCAGIHRGPAMVATLNDHLDYFGTTVKVALQIPGYAQGGELLLTREVAGDPQVAALLQSRGLLADILQVSMPGFPDGILHRLIP
jgi:serine/threonine protein kinase/class 3 adenylate cyclase